MAGVDTVAAVAGRASWGVAALLVAANDALALRFGAVAVRGELSGLTRAASGHCYFSLKDADGAPALLRCAMFRRAAQMLDFAPADGQQVELRGRLGVYDARGELQMVVESMQRVGAGTLYEEFLRRRARLAALGLFDPARKRALVAYPVALGVITSLGAAALRDVLTTLQRRSPQVRVVIYPSPVQGADAPQALADALRLANARKEVDTLLLVRGGGSLEDLWAFNDERLVQAVAQSALPVVCGVGHETDVTLCDLAADLRAATPTAAAELAAPAAAEALAHLRSRGAAMQRAVERVLQHQGQRLDHLATRLGQPGRAVLLQSRRLDELALGLKRALVQQAASQGPVLQQLAGRLQRAARSQLAQQRLRLSAGQDRLQGQDPGRVLRRGYAWIEGQGGLPVVSVKNLQAGQLVRAVWADGRAHALVQDVEALPPTPP